MRERFTLSQARQALGMERDNKTLQRWLDRLGITPVADNPMDHRVKYITDADLQRVAEAAGRRLHTIAEPTRADLLARIERLEHELARLQGRPSRATYAGDSDAQPPPVMSSMSGASASSESRPRPSQGHYSRWADYQRITDYPEWSEESGFIPFTRFCDAHGVKVTTAKQHWKEQHIFRMEAFKIDKKVPAYAIDKENALLALRYWRDRGLLNMATIGRCGVVNCPCADLAGDA